MQDFSKNNIKSNMNTDLGPFEDLLNQVNKLDVSDSFDEKLLLNLNKPRNQKSKNTADGSFAFLIILLLANALALGFGISKSISERKNASTPNPLESYFKTNNNFQY